MTKYHLKVVTPTSLLVDEKVDKVIVRTIEGDVCVLKNHTMYLSPLGIGALRVFIDGKEKKAAISDGFIEVGASGVNIIATSCEWVENIDLQRCQKQKIELEENLKSLKTLQEQKYYRLLIKKQANMIALASK